MSLKAFHVVFILVSTLLCVIFGAWALREYVRTREGAMLAAFVGALVAAAALAVYARWFLRKTRQVRYL